MPAIGEDELKEVGQRIVQAAALAGVDVHTFLEQQRTDAPAVIGHDASEEPLLLGIIALEERVGANPGALLGALLRLSQIRLGQGDHVEAIELARRAETVAVKRLGPRPLQLATCWVRQADAWEGLPRGGRSRAVALYRRAMALFAEVDGADPSRTVAIEVRLAATLIAAKRYPAAEAALQAALIRCQKIRPRAVQQLQTLANLHAMLADCHLHAGRRRESLEEARRAARYARRGGMTAPEANLAMELAGNGRFTDAVRRFAASFDDSEQRLRRQGRAMDGDALDKLLSVGVGEHDQHCVALAMSRPRLPSAVRLALAITLLRKCRAVDLAAERQRAQRALRDPSQQKQVKRLAVLRARLSHQTIAADDADGDAEVGRRLRALRREADALEAELAHRALSSRRRGELPSRAEIIDRVASALPAHAALIEFVRATEFDFEWLPGRGSPWRRDHYLAFVVRKGHAPVMVDLGLASRIDQLVLDFTHCVGNETSTDPARPTEWRPVARVLFDRLLRPLLQALAAGRGPAADHLFLAPDSQLHLVPFAALLDGERALFDDYRLTLVSSGRDLLRFRERTAANDTIAVVADPDYGNRGVAPGPGTRAIAEDLRNLAQLPGTRLEAMCIRRLFPRAEVLTGRRATEHNLLALQAPGVLHVASHGQYWGRDLKSDDPLLRTALALAGAQDFADRTDDRQPDGIVTALELAGMNLDGTQLAVLSACSSGVGDIDDFGGGIAGLQRAALVAGAEAVVCSLWKIDDRVAARFMRHFYRALSEGESRDLALWRAARAIRDMGTWKGIDCSHPHVWAAFVPIGRPGALRRLPRLGRA